MNSLIFGKKYELEIFNIVSKCLLNDKKFNTQNKEDLGGIRHFSHLLKEKLGD